MIAETIRDAERLHARRVPMAHIANMTGVNEITLRDYFASRTVVAPVENTAKASDLGTGPPAPCYAPKPKYKAPQPSDKSMRGLCDLIARKRSVPVSSLIAVDATPHILAARDELVVLAQQAGHSTGVIAKFLQRSPSGVLKAAKRHGLNQSTPPPG